MSIGKRGTALLPFLPLAFGCAGDMGKTPVPEGELVRLERRIQLLERRVARLERRPATDVRLYPAGPHDVPEGLGVALAQALDDLLQERMQLLQRYTPNHPDVKILDREIARLREQLERNPPPLRELSPGAVAP